MSARRVIDSIAYALCANDESGDPDYGNDYQANLIEKQLEVDGHVGSDALALASLVVAILGPHRPRCQECGGVREAIPALMPGEPDPRRGCTFAFDREAAQFTPCPSPSCDAGRVAWTVWLPAVAAGLHTDDTDPTPPYGTGRPG